jgi:subtilisin family serine protease
MCVLLVMAPVVGAAGASQGMTSADSVNNGQSATTDAATGDVEYGGALSQAVSAVGTQAGASATDADTPAPADTTQNAVIRHRLRNGTDSLSGLSATDPVRVRLTLAEDADFDQSVADVRETGAVARTFPDNGIISAVVTLGDVEALETVAGVRSVSLERTSAPAAATNRGDDTDAGSAARSEPSHAWESMNEYTGADTLHTLGYNGSGVTVAVIDTGVYETAALQGKIVAERDFSSPVTRDAYDPKGDDPTDYFSHGSNVAGIVAASESTVEARNNTRLAAGNLSADPTENARYEVEGVAPGTDVVNAKVFQLIERYNAAGTVAVADGGTATINIAPSNARGRYLKTNASWTDASNDVSIDYIDANGNVVAEVRDGNGYAVGVDSRDTDTTTTAEFNGTATLLPADVGQIDAVRVTGENVTGTATVSLDVGMYAALAYHTDTARAIQWAAAETGADDSPRADVISVSISPDGSGTRAAAIEDAIDNGSLYVTSAGNAGNGRTMPAPKLSDASITVGAIDRNGEIAGFSQPGATENKPDLVAPGVAIPSAGPPERFPRVAGFDNNGTVKSGTSMATPYVSGSAALYIQAYREMHGESPSPTATKAALTAGAVNSTRDPATSQAVTRYGEFSASPVDLPRTNSRDTLYGAGTVNPYNAYVSFVASGDSNASVVGTPVDGSLPPAADQATNETLQQHAVLAWLDDATSYELTSSTDGAGAGPGGERIVVESPNASMTTYDVTRTAGTGEWALASSYPLGETGVAVRDAPGMSLDANDSAAYAVPVGQPLPTGSFVDNTAPLRFLAFENGSGDVDVAIYDAAGMQTGGSHVGEPAIEQAIAPNSSGGHKVVYAANFTNGSTRFAAGHNYPLKPLPSTASISVVDGTAGNNSAPGQVTLDVTVETAGRPYSYGAYGAPDASHFAVTVGNETVPTSNVTVLEQRPDKYRLRFSAPSQPADGSYDAQVNVTDEKHGVSNTASATAADAIGYSGRTSGGAAAVSLIIDGSGSMGEGPGSKLRGAKTASELFVTDQLADDEHVAIVSYGYDATNLTTMRKLAGNRSAINASIYNAENVDRGSTNIGEGMILGRQNLDLAPNGSSKAAVLLTDGHHNTNNPYSDNEIVNVEAPRYANAGYDVYSVAYGAGADEQLLIDIANATTSGGNVSAEPNKRFYNDPSASEIQAIYRSIRADVTGASTLHTSSGTVAAGLSTATPVEIDDSVDSSVISVTLSDTGSGSGVAATTSGANTTTVELVDPAGRPVVLNDSTPTGTNRSTVTHSQTGTTTSYRLADPAAGNWTYRIDNGQSSSVDYETVVTGSARTTLSVATDGTRFANDSEVELTATLLGDDGGVSNATVHAAIDGPNRSVGLVGMAEQEPGVYTGTFSASEPGEYTATIEADTGSLTRTAETSWRVYNADGVLRVDVTNSFLQATEGGTATTTLNVTRPATGGGSMTGTAAGTAGERSDFSSRANELATLSAAELDNATASPALKQAARTIKATESGATNASVATATGATGSTVYIEKDALTGPGGATIAPADLTVTPGSITAQPGERQTVSMRVSVPDQTPVGNYTGTVTFILDGTVVTEDVRVEVTEAGASIYIQRFSESAAKWAAASDAGKAYYETEMADELTNLYFDTPGSGDAAAEGGD